MTRSLDADVLIHICNNFISSKVHVNLIAALADRFPVLIQLIFVPIRKAIDRDVNRPTLPNVVVDYCKCQGRVLKFFPLLKVIVTFFAFLFFLKNKPQKSSRKVLAHTLWSDGSIAYFYKILTGHSYHVTVRNTDLNWFLPRLPHYRWLIRLIIKNSDGLIFVTSAYQRKFSARYPELAKVAKRISVISNGVDSYWNENKVPMGRRDTGVVCFIGRFDKNKNLDGIVSACEVVRESAKNLKLFLIGGSEQDLMALVPLKALPDWIEVRPAIKDRDVLSALLRRASVFFMPSHHETFGLVYIEALSQGCPVIFNNGEGIDGLFPGAEFACGVDSRKPNDMARALVEMLARHAKGFLKPVDIDSLENYRWENVAEMYFDNLYPEK